MKRRLLIFSLIAITLGWSGRVIFAADQKDTFAKANQDYAAEHFQDAIIGYETVVRSGPWSANLFYDLGNAWFRAGNFGQAILNYERARALEPHHPETEANLRLVRDEARALELKKTAIDRYLEIGTARQYSVVGSIAFWLACFCGARLFFSGRRSAVAMVVILFCLIVFFAAAFAVYTLETGNRGTGVAIVTGNNIEARLATADNANTVLALPPGSEITLLSQRGDWIYAALPNDLRGRIPANGAERVRLDSPLSSRARQE